MTSRTHVSGLVGAAALLCLAATSLPHTAPAATGTSAHVATIAMLTAEPGAGDDDGSGQAAPPPPAPTPPPTPAGPGSGYLPEQDKYGTDPTQQSTGG
ncbi:hypothetical protein [Pseudonocardia spinosispora]|uniref:hypothetical protein n=1 Tax=Pseudonocardia spinosispora TaxID=103441 RepID=UPI0012EB633F|nr:hypothetical protein [Pseudonocardia spinosispora]